MTQENMDKFKIRYGIENILNVKQLRYLSDSDLIESHNELDNLLNSSNELIKTVDLYLNGYDVGTLFGDNILRKIILNIESDVMAHNIATIEEEIINRGIL
jgi:hypothetical protein